jgi:hypothetical protein
MYETHLALTIAATAVWIAARRQPRLPAYRLEWNDILGRDIYAKRLILMGPGEVKQPKLELSINDQGKSVIKFPDEIIDDEYWGVSLRCGRGEGGFRIEFILETPSEPPRQFLALAFSPSPTEISLFNAQDTILAKIP